MARHSDLRLHNYNHLARDEQTMQLAVSLNGTDAPTGVQCDKIQLKYDVVPAIICGCCFIFGVMYTFFGYRFFKATMFFTGLMFGGVITYMICLEEAFLPLEGKIGIAVAAGVLCGLITMLVQYVGLFVTGFHFGGLLGVAGLIVMEQWYSPTTKWIPIGMMFGTGLVFAVLSLYFQKGLTILGTSVFGAALMSVAVDYFVELFLMVNYVWDRIRAEPTTHAVCWFSWLILGLWPAAFLVGALCQWRVTGKGFDHNEAVPSRRVHKVNLQRLRARDRRDAQHSRYRHLYQVRRCNGDVISQDFIQGVQPKMSPAIRSITNVPTEGDMDSGQTTLTHIT